MNKCDEINPWKSKPGYYNGLFNWKENYEIEKKHYKIKVWFTYDDYYQYKEFGTKKRLKKYIEEDPLIENIKIIEQ